MAKKTAPVDNEDDNNYTDVNSAPGTLDEDDNNYTDVNSAPGTLDEDGEAEEGEEVDNSPLIQTMTLVTRHAQGASTAHTRVTASVHGKNGLETRHFVVPGGLTSKKLIAALTNIDVW